MKRQYQHMIEQVTLDDQAKTAILERMEEQQPRRKVRPMRAALIAACLCMALIGTAFAGKAILGVQLSNIFNSGYALNIKGLAKWTDAEFGRQMTANYHTSEHANFPDVCVPFGSRAELEDYVGLPLAGNAMLEAGARWIYPTDKNDLEKGFSYFEGSENPDAQPLYRYYLNLRGGNDQIHEGWISSSSIVDGVDVLLRIAFWGELGDPMSSLTALYGGNSSFEGETYEMRNGTQAQLVSVNSAGYQGFAAFFVQDGNLYFLTFDQGVGQVPVDMSVIHQVLDAFE